MNSPTFCERLNDRYDDIDFGICNVILHDYTLCNKFISLIILFILIIIIFSIIYVINN